MVFSHLLPLFLPISSVNFLSTLSLSFSLSFSFNFLEPIFWIQLIDPYLISLHSISLFIVFYFFLSSHHSFISFPYVTLPPFLHSILLLPSLIYYFIYLPYISPSSFHPWLLREQSSEHFEEILGRRCPVVWLSRSPAGQRHEYNAIEICYTIVEIHYTIVDILYYTIVKISYTFIEICYTIVECLSSEIIL